MDLVYIQLQKIRKHRADASESYGVSFEISKTHVRTEITFFGDWFYSPVKNISKSFGVFFICIATHGRFINCNFCTSGFNKKLQFFRYDREQGLSNFIPV